MTTLWIFIGGGLGALTRWALASSIHTATEKTPLSRFPLGILTCNLIGCFLIGLLLGHFAQKEAAPWTFPLLSTGFLGGFTTFSSFGKDTHLLISSGSHHLALLNILLSLIPGIIAVWLGIRLTTSP